MDGDLDMIEEKVFANPDPGVLSGLQRIKRDLREIRRVTGPHREVLGQLLHEELGFIRKETRVFLRDCADHAARVAEVVDASREHASDLMNAYLSMLGHRQNEVMKVLTIMAAIFIPLSFIAGIYGMNFDPDASTWNMPELGWAWGYPAILSLMGLVAAGLLLFFKRRGWLG